MGRSSHLAKWRKCNYRRRKNVRKRNDHGQGSLRKSNYHARLIKQIQLSIK